MLKNKSRPITPPSDTPIHRFSQKDSMFQSKNILTVEMNVYMCNYYENKDFHVWLNSNNVEVCIKI